MGIFYSKCEKSGSQNRKNEKMAQNGQFWAYFGVFEWLNLFRPNFAPAVKLYFLSFLRIMMGGNLKSPAITRNKLFCVKNEAFLPNHKVFWVKMYLISNIRYTIDWDYFEILNSHLYFLTRIKKRSNIQCKIWNCPLYPCFQCTVRHMHSHIAWDFFIGIIS